MFYQDKKGAYRLEAVVAVTPKQLYDHPNKPGSTHPPLAQPSRVVGCLFFAGSDSPVETDTDYTVLLDAVRTEVTAVPAAATQEG